MQNLPVKWVVTAHQEVVMHQEGEKGCNYRQRGNQMGGTRGIGALRGSNMTRGDAAWTNKWQMVGKGSSLSRGISALRGRKDGRGRQRDKMTGNYQPVETKRGSQGFMTTKATSNNNDNDNHNDTGTL
jgi:hypothetical protein